MAEVTLKSGKVIPVDVSGVTVQEWRDFVSPNGTVATENAVVMKCTGMEAEEIGAMTYQDFRRVVKAIVRAMQEPLADPL